MNYAIISIAAWLTLNLADLGLSLVAFSLGAKEGNAVLGRLLDLGVGWFVVGKVAIALFVAVLAIRLWGVQAVRAALWAGLALFAVVITYELVGILVISV